ncbi:hypothetical protein J6590_078584 [Homalodisca vitripennis]|nr:hypothetical protein J6590_078584 [Homalodisca vitripennis]
MIVKLLIHPLPDLTAQVVEVVRGRHRQIFSYPRDWDIDWVKTQAEAQRRRGGRHRSWGSDWESGDPVPVYDYQAAAPAALTAPTALPLLHPRAVVLPSEKVDTRGVWQVHQRGSSLIPHKGATVRVTPYKGSNNKFYRGVVTSTISDGPPRRRRGHRNRQKNRKNFKIEISSMQQLDYANDFLKQSIYKVSQKAAATLSAPSPCKQQQTKYTRAVNTSSPGPTGTAGQFRLLPAASGVYTKFKPIIAIRATQTPPHVFTHRLPPTGEHKTV